MVTEEKVLTKKADKLCSYEMVVIINPQLSDEQLETVINNTNNFITGKGGVVSEVVRWGKKNLAYPIKHLSSGTYILTRFTLKPGFSKELENNLRISEPVLRHLLIKLEI
jgi:small subunit ribosomal protein S6